MANQAEKLLVQRIRDGQEEAWQELIGQFEGRLFAYVHRRIADRATCEDIEQEAFIGFANSLPNFDENRPLESFLFSICSNKLTDHLRRSGRRPAIPISATEDSQGPRSFTGPARAASTLFRSQERKNIEVAALEEAIREQTEHWKSTGKWEKLKCLELIMVCGMANRAVADQLNIPQTQVANYKFEFVTRLRDRVKSQSISADIFPELADQTNEISDA